MADDTQRTRKRRFPRRNYSKMLTNSSTDGNKKKKNAEKDNEPNTDLCTVLEGLENTDKDVKTPLPLIQGKLGRTFFNSTAPILAKNLLGKVLFRELDGEVLRGRIVETEAYLGETDKACHTYGGKRTPRTEPMYMAPGTVYIYLIYGMYFCLNISSEDTGGAVLIRALEPIDGIEKMKELRGKKRKDSVRKLKEHELCNGPSKLCQAMGITKANLNKEDMALSSTLWIEEDNSSPEEYLSIVPSVRIGVDSYGPDAARQPLRFYVYGNKCVSVRDRKSEKSLQKAGQTLHGVAMK